MWARRNLLRAASHAFTQRCQYSHQRRLGTEPIPPGEQAGEADPRDLYGRVP